LDALHLWCLRRLLRIHYTEHVTNAEVLIRTDHRPLCATLRDRRRLRLFGHVARSEPHNDHVRALQLSLRECQSTGSVLSGTYSLYLDKDSWRRRCCVEHWSYNGVGESTRLNWLAEYSGNSCTPLRGLPAMMMMMSI